MNFLIRGMYTAAAGALVAQTNVDTIADNLANVSTTGFKRTLMQVSAADSLDLNRVQTDPGSSAGRLTGGHPVSVPIGRLGFGSEVYATPTQFDQGALKQTGNPYDVALTGNGFFTIQTPDGVRYTRNGAFVRDPRGLLLTQDGNLVLGTGGAVALPQGTSTVIGADGSVSVDGNVVDKLRITQFGNIQNLAKQGGSLFVDAGAQPALDTSTSVSQGRLETSNSNVVQSMVDLITAQRWFEANQKVIQTEAQATTQALTSVGISK